MRLNRSLIVLLRFMLGLFLVLLAALLPPLFVGPKDFYHSPAMFDTALNSTLVNVISLGVALVVFSKLESYPQRNPSLYIIPMTLMVTTFFLIILIIGHFAYSVKILLVGFLLLPSLLAVFYKFDRKTRQLRLLCLHSVDISSLKTTSLIEFKSLYKPVLPSEPFDGVVVDLHDFSLSPDWERFLSECAIKKIRVYNLMHLRERLTGKVNVNHLAENSFGELAPSDFVIVIKRLIDLFFLVLVAPLLLPLMLIISIWIVLDSEGGPFYIQKRMGLGGRYFKLIKFRSMRINHDDSYFTVEDESHRITKVGKFIRKYRIDELPQFWNVLKGEMSLIGPRPESAALAEYYQNQVPFFMYRHVVRPGISGWAQVMQGYVVGIDEMKDKLAYDLYYIKNFSLWLDLLIWYKTIKTVLTGFGSR